MVDEVTPWVEQHLTQALSLSRAREMSA
jgi:hypothetical protein